MKQGNARKKSAARENKAAKANERKLRTIEKKKALSAVALLNICMHMEKCQPTVAQQCKSTVIISYLYIRREDQHISRTHSRNGSRVTSCGYNPRERERAIYWNIKRSKKRKGYGSVS